MLINKLKMRFIEKIWKEKRDIFKFKRILKYRYVDIVLLQPY